MDWLKIQIYLMVDLEDIFKPREKELCSPSFERINSYVHRSWLSGIECLWAC